MRLRCKGSVSLCRNIFLQPLLRFNLLVKKGITNFVKTKIIFQFEHYLLSVLSFQVHLPHEKTITEKHGHFGKIISISYQNMIES